MAAREETEKIMIDPMNGRLAGDCNVHEKAAGPDAHAEEFARQFLERMCTTAEIGRGSTDDKFADPVPAVLITKRDHSKEMAELFGLKLDERFKVKFPNGEISRHEFRFVSMGGVVDDADCARSDIVMSLLQCTAQIVKLPWKPKDGEWVYYVDRYGSAESKKFTSNNTWDLAMYKLGKLYATFDEALRNRVNDHAFWESVGKELKV